MLRFITCDHCGKRITDESTLMTVQYDIWKRPECGKENSPLNNNSLDSFDTSEEEESEVKIKVQEKVVSIL